MTRVYDSPLSSASFHSESPLRARHDEFASGETARRATTAGDARGSADFPHATHAAKVAWIPWGERDGICSSPSEMAYAKHDAFFPANSQKIPSFGEIEGSGYAMLNGGFSSGTT